MTTRFKIEIEHLPDDVVVDVELWTSCIASGRKEFNHEKLVIDTPGERKEDYKFTRVYRTLNFVGAGFNEYVYRGQAFMVRERKK